MIRVNPKRLPGWPRNVFYGWWIVVVAASADALKHGTFNRGFSFYVLPLTRELGVGQSLIGLAEMLGRLEGGFLGPLMGWITDRYGPRPVMVLGAVASGAGFMLLSVTGNYVYFLLVFVGLLSLGFRSGYNNAIMPAINQWFRRRRGLAMSLASVGSPLGGMIIAPLIGYLVFEIGWREAAFISGCLVLAVVAPLAIFIQPSPESRGLLPDGDKPRDPPGSAAVLVTSPAGPGAAMPGEAGSHAPAPETDFTVKEAVRTTSYWLLVLAVGMRNTVHSGTQFLLVPIMFWFLQGSGRTEDQIEGLLPLLVGLMSLSSVIMNPITGWFADKWSKQRLSAAAMIGGGAALAALVNDSGHLWQALLFVVLLAFSETANPLAWAIMGDFFGRSNYATLRGWQHLPDQLMSMSTPFWMGLIYDRTDSYVWALIPLVALYVLAAISYWVIPRPKPPDRRPY